MPSSQMDPSITEESSLATKSQHRQLVPNLNIMWNNLFKMAEWDLPYNIPDAKRTGFNLHPSFAPAITCKYLMVIIFF